MFKKLDWLQQIEESLQKIEDPDWNHKKPVTFYYDLLKKNLFASKSDTSLKRLKKLMGSSYKLTCPDDSLIFLRPKKTGVIIVSSKKNRVLKIFLNQVYADQLNKEIDILRKVRGSSFEVYAPKFIAAGTFTEGGSWLLTDASKDSDELNENYLFQHLDQIVMDPMKHFYDVFGIKTLDIQSWFKNVTHDIERHERASDLQMVLKLAKKEIEKFENLHLVTTTLHGDLHKANILKSGSDIIIIDWEGTYEGPVLQDYFDFLRRYLKKNPKSSVPFWDYISGKKSELPKVYRHFYSQFSKWYSKNFGIAVPNGSERLFFYIYCLERTSSLIRSNRNDAPKKLVFEMKALVESITIK